MKKKKNIRYFLTFLLCSAAIVSCGKQKEVKEAELQDTILEGKTITFLTSQSKFRAEYQKMADQVLRQYGCNVEFQVIADNDYVSFVKLKLMTSEVPDIFEFNCPMNNTEIDAPQYCVDLSDEEWVQRLIDVENLYDPKDGKIYALPREGSSGLMAVYYNVDTMKHCGIENPHPKTYEEFITLLDQVKKKGVVPFYETNADTWTTQIFMTSGIPITLGNKADETFAELMNGTAKWSEVPEVEEVMNQYIDLIKRGYVNNNHLSAKYDSAVDKLGTGEIAMYLTTEQTAANIVSKYPDCRIGAFAIPFGDQDLIAVSEGTQGLFIPKDGEQVETAKNFLEVWSQPEIQNLFFETQHSTAPFKDTTNTGSLDCVQYLKKEYLDTGKYVVQMNDQISECSMILEDLWDGYTDMISWRKTPNEVLENFQIIFDSFMKNSN